MASVSRYESEFREGSYCWRLPTRSLKLVNRPSNRPLPVDEFAWLQKGDLYYPLNQADIVFNQSQ